MAKILSKTSVAVLAVVLLVSAVLVFIFGINNSNQPALNSAGTPPESGRQSGGLPLSSLGGQSQVGGSGVQNPGQLNQGMGSSGQGSASSTAPQPSSGSASSAANSPPVQIQPAPVYPPCNYCKPGMGRVCPLFASSYPCNACGGYSPQPDAIACPLE